jgi:putative ABC transport system substrate-binding protein
MQFGPIRRRDFVTLLGGAAASPLAAWVLAARAQQPALPVIGSLSTGSPGSSPAASNSDGVAFRRGLAENGFVEGRNVKIEYRWADHQYDLLPALAAELIARQVAVIFANGPAALAAKAATTTIPIVFTTASDPVKAGLVASFARPGGNLTGVTNANVELVPKRLELLHELVPGAKVIAVLLNPANPNAETQSRDVQAAARALGIDLHILHASSERDFDAVAAALDRMRAGGLVIGNDGFLIGEGERLAALAVRHALPAISQYREFAAAGGLMSYGGSSEDTFRTLGVYTGRILKGEKPADLPVQQSTRIELVINLKTAKALGLTFPITLSGRADEVIE